MEKTLFVKVGQVVKAKAGRDVGKVFLVYSIVDDEFVKIVDGKSRKLIKPKLKKIKHLSLYNDVINIDVENFNDSYIRKMLKIYD